MNIYACECSESTIKEHREKADKVLYGEVVSKRPLKIPPYDWMTETDSILIAYQYTFKVIEDFKNCSSNNTIKITADASSSCAIDFTLNKTYLIFSNSIQKNDPNTWLPNASGDWTFFCSGNIKIDRITSDIRTILNTPE